MRWKIEHTECRSQSPPIICHAPTASRREAIRGGGLANDWRRLWCRCTVDVANNNLDGTSYMSNRGELSSRNFAAVKCTEMRQQYNAEWKRRARSLPEFREYEQQRKRVKTQIARKNPVYRDTGRECNKKKMKMARKDAAYRDLVKKLAGLWLVGEVGNHVAIYGSKVAEGFSVFQRRSCDICYGRYDNLATMFFIYLFQ